MFGCAVCLLLVPIVGCNSNAVIALLLIGMFIYGFITGGEYGVITEYAPDFAGTVFGVANTLASATGFVGPMLVGYLLDHGVSGLTQNICSLNNKIYLSINQNGSVRQQWNIIWYLSFAIYVFGGTFYEVFGTAEPQSWGSVSVRDGKDRTISVVSYNGVIP